MTLETHLMDMIRVAVRDVVREELGSRSSTAETAVEYVTAKEAARMASVSLSTLRQWMKSGSLDVFGQGRVKRVKISDVRRCLERGGEPESTVESPETRARAMFRSLPGAR